MNLNPFETIKSPFEGLLIYLTGAKGNNFLETGWFKIRPEI
jgi:hypothetical protein